MTLKDDTPPGASFPEPTASGAASLLGPILRAALAPQATPRDPLEVLRERATYSLAVMSYHGGIWSRTMAEVGGMLLQAQVLCPEQWDDFLASLGLKPEAIDGFLIMHEQAERMRREGGNAAGALRKQ